MNKLQPIERPGLLIATVLLCHFLTSFTALGMPVFLPKLTQSLLTAEQQYWIGWFYSAPLICMALSAPFWGRFADRYGKRLSLMRAQLGLMSGFLITGFSDSLLQFSIGIIIQGLCGGTFAASNAYLASRLPASQLPSSMNWMQVSARASLLIAPIVLGLFMNIAEPRRVFVFLAILPLTAFIITCFQSKDVISDTSAKASDKPTTLERVVASRTVVSIIQFCFYFATVVTYPYFLPWAEHLGIESDVYVGLMFSLPHLCYLILMLPGLPRFNRLHPLILCQFSFLALMIAGWQQAIMSHPDGLVLWRLVTGASLFFGFLGLHKLIAGLTHAGNAGRQFGWFDAIGKWSAVIAGLISGLLITRSGLASPFYLSTAAIVIAWLTVTCTHIKQHISARKIHPCPTE